jgi:hypothetical protein
MGLPMFTAGVASPTMEAYSSAIRPMMIELV